MINILSDIFRHSAQKSHHVNIYYTEEINKNSYRLRYVDASVVINGIYWAVGSPKLMTIPDAKTLLRPANTPWLPSSKGAPALPHRMLAICDISADPGGSIEFMNECTTIDTPFCLYDADRNKDTKSFKGPGVLVSYESSNYFCLKIVMYGNASFYWK